MHATAESPWGQQAFARESVRFANNVQTVWVRVEPSPLFLAFWGGGVGDVWGGEGQTQRWRWTDGPAQLEIVVRVRG